jgi:pilus assembly protein Flp/PilA
VPSHRLTPKVTLTVSAHCNFAAEAVVHPFTNALRRVPSFAPMKKLIKNFIADESGATAIEYGLIAAGIALAIIAAVNTLGGTLKTKFTSINTSLQ